MEERWARCSLRTGRTDVSASDADVGDDGGRCGVCRMIEDANQIRSFDLLQIRALREQLPSEWEESRRYLLYLEDSFFEAEALGLEPRDTVEDLISLGNDLQYPRPVGYGRYVEENARVLFDRWRRAYGQDAPP